MRLVNAVEDLNQRLRPLLATRNLEDFRVHMAADDTHCVCVGNHVAQLARDAVLMVDKAKFLPTEDAAYILVINEFERDDVANAKHLVRLGGVIFLTAGDVRVELNNVLPGKGGDCRTGLDKTNFIVEGPNLVLTRTQDGIGPRDLGDKFLRLEEVARSLAIDPLNPGIHRRKRLGVLGVLLLKLGETVWPYCPQVLLTHSVDNTLASGVVELCRLNLWRGEDALALEVLDKGIAKESRRLFLSRRKLRGKIRVQVNQILERGWSALRIGVFDLQLTNGLYKLLVGERHTRPMASASVKNSLLSQKLAKRHSIGAFTGIHKCLDWEVAAKILDLINARGRMLSKALLELGENSFRVKRRRTAALYAIRISHVVAASYQQLRPRLIAEFLRKLHEVLGSLRM